MNTFIQNWVHFQYIIWGTQAIFKSMLQSYPFSCSCGSNLQYWCSKNSRHSGKLSSGQMWHSKFCSRFCICGILARQWWSRVLSLQLGYLFWQISKWGSHKLNLLSILCCFCCSCITRLFNRCRSQGLCHYRQFSSNQVSNSQLCRRFHLCCQLGWQWWSRIFSF